MWKSRWPSWAPVPNKPTVSVDWRKATLSQSTGQINVFPRTAIQSGTGTTSSVNRQLKPAPTYRPWHVQPRGCQVSVMICISFCSLSGFSFSLLAALLLLFCCVFCVCCCCCCCFFFCFFVLGVLLFFVLVLFSFCCWRTRGNYFLNNKLLRSGSSPWPNTV